LLRLGLGLRHQLELRMAGLGMGLWLPGLRSLLLLLSISLLRISSV
jgi:hypothetical protein